MLIFQFFVLPLIFFLVFLFTVNLLHCRFCNPSSWLECRVAHTAADVKLSEKDLNEIRLTVQTYAVQSGGYPDSLYEASGNANGGDRHYRRRDSIDPW